MRATSKLELHKEVFYQRLLGPARDNGGKAGNWRETGQVKRRELDERKRESERFFETG